MEKWQFDIAMWESARASREYRTRGWCDIELHIAAIVHSHTVHSTLSLTVTRLYAFFKCEVIVDPVIDLAQDFSADDSASGLKWVSIGTNRPSSGREIASEALAKALEDQMKANSEATASPEVTLTLEEWQGFGIENLHPADYVKSVGNYFQPILGDWGFINRRPYGERGWCCAEFSVALRNNRIVNLHDPQVQQVLAMRGWPSTVDQYTAMMDGGGGLPVRFTNKGDLAAVLYHFYKMTAR